MANWYRPNYPEVRSRVLGLPEKVRACLFDLDGVLTDTASLHTKAWKAMFDAYLAERAERTGEKFVPFDPAADYHTYVDGKKREDGVRSFLSSRAIEIPDGSPDDPGAAETVYGLGNRKNDMLHKLLRDDGAQVFDGSRRYLEAVTRPFSFEGKRRSNQAENGIAALRESCDTLIVIPNDRLLQMGDAAVSLMDAFRSADEVLLNGVQGITDLITTPGLINVDFADVKGIMSGAGTALMGIGSARGEGRSLKAAEIAINSPLLEASMEGAQGVLMSIAGGSDLGLFEINEAASLVQDAAHPDANIIFGTVIDDSLGDEVRVTVIAAGFDVSGPGRKPVMGETGGAHRIESAKAGKLTSTLFEPVDAVSVPLHTNGATLSIGGDDDDVDVPPFMRR